MAPSEAKDIANLAKQVVAKRKGTDSEDKEIESISSVPKSRPESKETKSSVSIFDDIPTVSVESNVKVSSLFPKKQQQQQSQLQPASESTLNSSVASKTSSESNPPQSSIDTTSNVKVSSILPKNQTITTSTTNVTENKPASDTKKSIFDDVPVTFGSYEPTTKSTLSKSQSLASVSTTTTSGPTTTQQSKFKSIFDDIPTTTVPSTTSTSSSLKSKEVTSSTMTKTNESPSKTTSTNAPSIIKSSSLASIFDDLPPLNTKTGTKTTVNIFENLPSVNNTQTSAPLTTTKESTKTQQISNETTKEENIKREENQKKESVKEEKKTESPKVETKKELQASATTQSTAQKSSLASIFGDIDISTPTASKSSTTTLKKATIDDLFGNPEAIFAPKSTAPTPNKNTVQKSDSKVNIFDNPLDTNKPSSIFNNI
jgi:hypothetical protein